MKAFTLISYQESRCGFREDDWQIIRRITDEKELYEALKEGYLQDASSRNNYPILSFPISRVYIERKIDEEDFYALGYERDEEDEVYDYRWEDSDEDIDLSEYKPAIDKFKRWEEKVKSLVPRLKENKRQIDKKEAEMKKLKELAEKYGYELVKEIKKGMK